MERNVMRLVAVEHLRSAYGIKIKNWNKSKNGSKPTTAQSGKIFGMPLESLPCYYMADGSVPSFLVDACAQLTAHIDTEGLFRKSGSIVRLKALRAKLDAGPECLSDALPCDIAGLVKQFFRDLPEPVIPAELNEALLKAQQLPAEEDRRSATLLLSCLLSERNLSVLRHFFDFVHVVSLRSADNKMDSNNLSVILAPNLFHSGDGSEKMNANMEKRLRLQAAVIRAFVDNSKDFGMLPGFLMGKVPSMMGSEGGSLSPSLEEPENNAGSRRRRRSLGDMVNGALTKIKTSRTPTNTSQTDCPVFSSSATPATATPLKRKLPSHSNQSFGLSNKKRRSIKKNLGLELLPNVLFSGTSTPGSAYSASGVLDSSSKHASSPAARSSSRSAAKRKSQRLHVVQRVESGKAGCFSPKVRKMEAPRKSLRSRFSLGKSSKEAGSESIGWRLATQESTTSVCPTKDAGFTSAGLRGKKESKSCKFMSKSEDNLLTPQCDSTPLQTSWSAQTPDSPVHYGGRSFTDTPLNRGQKVHYLSEPAIAACKLPAGTGLPMRLCCASSAESLESSDGSPGTTRSQACPALMNTTEGIQEPAGRDLAPAVQCHGNPGEGEERTQAPETPAPRDLSEDLEPSGCDTPKRQPANDQKITFSQTESPALPLRSADSETCLYFNPAVKSPHGSQCGAAVGPSGGHGGDAVGEVELEVELQPLNCSQLIDALDIDSESAFRMARSPAHVLAYSSPSLEYVGLRPHSDHQNEPAAVPQGPDTQRPRVADHIQHFNTLTLSRLPKGPRARGHRTPLTFRRTPVHQSVRRIDALLRESRGPPPSAGQAGPTGMSVSTESVLRLTSPSAARVSAAAKMAPPVPPRKPGTLARAQRLCTLEDVTNQGPAPVGKTDVLERRSRLQHVADKDVRHYRGSPRNPLNAVRLLSATKPIDL